MSCCRSGFPLVRVLALAFLFLILLGGISTRAPAASVDSVVEIIPPTEASECAPLISELSAWTRIDSPADGTGCLLYRTVLPPGPAGVVECDSLADFGWVFLNGQRVGIMDRRQKNLRARIPERNGPAWLEIIFEAITPPSAVQGGPIRRPGVPSSIRFIVGTVPVPLRNWDLYHLPLQPAGLGHLEFAKVKQGVPAFWRATLDISHVDNTYLDMRQWGKGCVWVNGNSVGGFWNVGPVQTLPVPGRWLKQGKNEIIILDFIGPETPVISGLSHPIVDEPHAERDFGRKRQPNRRTVDPGQPVHSGEFSAENSWQEVLFKNMAGGRFFSIETLSAHDGRAFAAISELEILDEFKNPISRQPWVVAHVDSEELEREDGAAENAIDGRPETFWHSQWSAASPNHPHRLILDLGNTERISGFRYLARPGAPSGGRIKAFAVAVGSRLVEEAPPVDSLPSEGFLFSHFQADDREGLHLSWSIDGFQWLPVNNGNPLLKPRPGLSPRMRDPCLLRAPDGAFHLVWTIDWTGRAIGYATSRDLIHWSEQRLIPVMAHEPATLNCWAPEIFWDSGRKEFLIIWSSTVTNRFRESLAIAEERSNDRLFCTTTRDFRTFTPTRLFYDPGFNLIDATTLSVSNRYLLLFKDETFRPPRKQIRTAWGDRIHGPYGEPGDPISPAWVEGPTAFQLENDYVVYFRYYLQNRFGAVRSRDLNRWEDVSERLVLPPEARQGTVLKVPRELLLTLSQSGLIDIRPGPIATELRLGNWIWSDTVADKQTCRLWRSFNIPDDTLVSHAMLRITADNGYRVLLNGREIGRGGDLNSVTAYDLTEVMTPGTHALAVEAFNDAGNAGVILGLQVEFSNGRRLELVSDRSWRVVPREVKGWERRKVPQPGWAFARIAAIAGRHVWQRPERVILSPPVTEPRVRFWQRGWFLSTLLGTGIVVFTVSVWLGLQLLMQRRSHRMLERERERIARDIHDDLGAGLTQLTLTGELLLRDVRGHSEVQGRLDQLCGRARALLGTLDEIVWAVNPRLDSVQDFATFVCEQTQEYLRPTGIGCRLEVEDDLPATHMDLPQRRNLLLAVKEATRNVAKHSGATEVKLSIHMKDETLRVEVQDNGKGFDPEQGPTGRHGMSNLRERMVDIGGTCQISSAPGQGTRITFLLPLNTSRNSRWSWPFRRSALRETKP